MKLFSFRGEQTTYPANTMIAFSEALKKGAEGIAVDIHMTRDRKPLLIKEDTLSRTIDAVGLVRHHTLEEIQGARLVEPYAKYNQHVPSLEEYLEWAARLPHQTILILRNVAYFYPNLEREVMNTIDAFEGKDRLIIASGRINSLRLLHDHYPDMRLGWIPGLLTSERIESLKDLNIDLLVAPFEQTDRLFLETAAANGLHVYVQGVESKNQIERLESLGVEGVLTPSVARAREALGISKMPYTPEELAEDTDGAGQDTGESTMHKLARQAKEFTKTKGAQGGRGRNILAVAISMVICVAIATIVAGVAMNLLKNILG